MSGLHALTVNTEPTAEPHIYAEDDAAIYQSMFGGDGVCSIGQNCAATVISNNKVRVADGVLCVGGHMARVRYGEYQDCEIMNGQTGYNRNDIIVAKFVTTGTQGTDTYTLEVAQGTAVAGTAADPVLTQGNLYEGEKIRMMPLYRVKIEGLSIVAVEQMFDLIPTIPELQAQVTELNGNLTNIFQFELLGGAAAASGVVSFQLSEMFTQYKFICIRAYADGYADIKVIPSQLLPTLSALSGRGVSMHIKCSDSYFWQGNVGFYNNCKDVEIATVACNGWYGTIEIFGCK